MEETIAGQFIEGVKGPLFLLRRGPRRATRCLLVVPPFAEEMNKSRRMVTLLASELASRGISTVVPDLHGTGDSAGEFVEAEWPIWRNDVERSVRWCAAEGRPVTGILGIRLGCALACEVFANEDMPRLQRSAFWQPVFDGPRYVTQFLRLRIAASMASGVKETMSELRRCMTEIGDLEVAGYRFSARLANEIESVQQPVVFPDKLGEIAWFDLVRGGAVAEDSPGAAPTDATSVQAGPTRCAVPGEPFWASTEIVVNSGLLARTIEFIAREAAL